jgi:hypothetical protein
MNSNEVKVLHRSIEKVKKELATIGEMRPGALSEQYNVCGNPNCRCKDEKNPQRHGPYYQVSYTYKGRSTSEFVRSDEVETVKERLSNYRRFKELTEEWVDLSVKLAKLRKAQRAAMKKARAKEKT